MNAVPQASIKALAAAAAVLAKAGYNPSEPRDNHGQWSSGGGGAAYGSQPWPHGPSNKEIHLIDSLRVANRELHAYSKGGVSPEDEDHQKAAAKVKDLQAKLDATRAHRFAEKAKLMTASAQPSTSTNSQQAQQARRTEAERLAAQGQARRREAGLLSDIESAGGTAAPIRTIYPMTSGNAPGSAESLRQAAIDTSHRLAAAASNVSSILLHTKGALSTGDYSRIGGHVNAIKVHAAELRAHAQALPADLTTLHREASDTASRARAALSRATAALKERVLGDKAKKKKK